jgi:tape measure domain-containing protein
MVISELVSLLGFRVDNSGARQFDATMQNLQDGATNAAARIQSVFQTAALGVTAAFGSLVLIGKPIAQAGDEMTLAIAKLKSSLDESAISGGEAVAIYEKLYEVGQRTGIAANDSAQGFTQLQLAMKDMNYGASDTINLLEGIQSAGIIAGQSTADVTEVVRQLGQAFGKGKLNGDELVTLSERMPRLVREIQKEMKMTTAEFFDASSKGKLTPEMLAPALLAASKRSMEELKNFPMTMARAYAIASNAGTRFLADLDKELGLSKALGAAFIYIAHTLDSWRSGLGVIGDMVRSLGGLEGIARLVGIAMLIAFGGSILGAVGSLIKLFDLMAMAIVRAFLPLVGFAAWVLIVEDFVTWMQGGKSLFGERFGDFDKVLSDIKDKIEPFKAWFAENFNFGDTIENTRREFTNIGDFFVNLWEGIKNSWNSNLEGMKPQFEWLRGAARFLMDAFEPLKDFFAGVFDVILKNINAFFDRIMIVINGIKSAISSVLNSLPSFAAATESGGSGSAPAGQEQRRRNFGARGNLGEALVNPDLSAELSGMLRGFDVTGRMPSGGAAVNAPQNNNITNDITINAPAGDPASIASGVNAGMGRATDSMTTRLGNSLALGLGISSPRIEAPASP